MQYCEDCVIEAERRGGDIVILPSHNRARRCLFILSRPPSPNLTSHLFLAPTSPIREMLSFVAPKFSKKLSRNKDSAPVEP